MRNTESNNTTADFELAHRLQINFSYHTCKHKIDVLFHSLLNKLMKMTVESGIPCISTERNLRLFLERTVGV